jgi:hypothetical protein
MWAILRDYTSRLAIEPRLRFGTLHGVRVLRFQSERRDPSRSDTLLRRNVQRALLAQSKRDCMISVMQQSYMDIDFVKLTEAQAVDETRSVFGETDLGLNFIINTWFKVQHFTGKVEPVTTDHGCFQSYAYFQCLQSPYTLLSAYELWQRASYVEASILLRHSLEVFVQLRYFHKHPELCMNHVTEQPKGRRKFLTMFDDLAPGLYDVAYRNLSKITHGNIVLGFRGDLPASTSQGAHHTVPVVAGAQFERNLAMLVHAFWIITMLGFLNYYPRFFPKNTIALDAIIAGELSESQRWLESVFEHKRSNVKNPALFDSARPLVFI